MLPTVPAGEVISAIPSAVAPKLTISEIRTARQTAGHSMQTYIFAANG